MNQLSQKIKENEKVFEEKFVVPNGGVMPQHRDFGKTLERDLKFHLHSSTIDILDTIEKKFDENIFNSPAYKHLTSQWGQLDEDGVSIAVSRQALEETMTALTSIQNFIREAKEEIK